MRPVAFDLLVGGNGAEDDFGEFAWVEGPVRDASNDFEGVLDYGHGEVGAVVNQTRDVVFGHFGKLFLEDTFQTCEDDDRIAAVVVVDDSEFDLAVSFFLDGGLCRTTSVCSFT